MRLRTHRCSPPGRPGQLVNPNGQTDPGITAAHVLFADQLAHLTNLFVQNPSLQASSVKIEHGRIDVVAEGIHGVLVDWTHAIDPDRRDTALFAASYGVGIEDVLHSGATTVHVRRPLNTGRGAS